MKITSYDSQGNVLKATDSDGLIPDYIKSYDKNKSVLSLYTNVEFKCTKDDYFGNYLNVKNAEAMFNIDYCNYLKSPFAHSLAIGQIEGETIIKEPEFPEIDYEDKKLTAIINIYGSKSRERIERALCDRTIRDLDCLSESTWILSLVNHAIKNINRYIHRVESKETAFKVSLQSVINRYAFALKRMVKYKNTPEVSAQINVLKPFISSNAFYVKSEDLNIYYTNKFLMKLLNHLFLIGLSRRHDTYSLLHLLRGEDNSKINSQSNKSLYYSISSQEAPDITHTFTIRLSDGHQKKIVITDREIESLNAALLFESEYKILTQTFEEIYSGYKNSNYRKIWDNQIKQRMIDVKKSPQKMPEKIQSWSYLFFDELSKYNQISPEESKKEQECFYMLVYSLVKADNPETIKFDRFVIFHFFRMLRINNCQDQIGFFEKIYTINEILANADRNDIELLNRIKDWNQIDWYKMRIEAIDEMLSFLQPILNSYYVNETLISVDGLTNMIRSILRNRYFYPIVLIGKPRQLLKKMGCPRDYNIALLLNVLGALYDYNVPGNKKLLKSAPSLAYNELVRPFGIVDDKNNNKFLTQYDQYGTNYSVISSEMAQIIVDEAKKAKYYK